MGNRGLIVVIGAGIAGVSAAIWLQRSGREVVLVDPKGIGEGTSFGNAGVLAVSSVIPVTVPGLALKALGYAFDSDSPLFVLWKQLPFLTPWLIRYLLHANDADTRRIASGLAAIVCDSVQQHQDLATGSVAEQWLRDSDYIFAYPNRAAFEQENYVWSLRKEIGLIPEEIEGKQVSCVEPALGSEIKFLARLKNHGFVSNPSRYVKDLAATFMATGGRFNQAHVTGFNLVDGRLKSVLTKSGEIACDAAVMAAGIWSRNLLMKIGLKIPMQSERGYHIVFKNPSVRPQNPVMVAAGKFVATPMANGLRCAGVLEFGGLGQPPSLAPLKLIHRQAKATFPNLSWEGEEEWSGHRPALVDSLPLIGEVGQSRLFLAFGHHHIGLTAGPKTGRILARIIAGDDPGIDPLPFSPNRFLHGRLG